MYLFLALLAPLALFGLIPGLAWYEERLLAPDRLRDSAPSPTPPIPDRPTTTGHRKIVRTVEPAPPPVVSHGSPIVSPRTM